MKRNFTFWSAAVFSLVGSFGFSQTPGFDDDVQDVPVHQGIVPMVLVGALLISILVYKYKINTK